MKLFESGVIFYCLSIIFGIQAFFLNDVLQSNDMIQLGFLSFIIGLILENKKEKE